MEVAAMVTAINIAINATTDSLDLAILQQVEIQIPLPQSSRFLLPLDEAIPSRAVFVIVPGSGGRTETLLQPAK